MAKTDDNSALVRLLAQLLYWQVDRCDESQLRNAVNLFLADHASAEQRSRLSSPDLADIHFSMIAAELFRNGSECPEASPSTLSHSTDAADTPQIVQAFDSEAELSSGQIVQAVPVQAPPAVANVQTATIPVESTASIHEAAPELSNWNMGPAEPKVRLDMVSAYYKFDAVIRLLTFNCLSFTSLLIVLGLVGVCAMPFLIEGPQLLQGSDPKSQYIGPRPDLKEAPKPMLIQLDSPEKKAETQEILDSVGRSPDDPTERLDSESKSDEKEEELDLDIDAILDPILNRSSRNKPEEKDTTKQFTALDRKVADDRLHLQRSAIQSIALGDLKTAYVKLNNHLEATEKNAESVLLQIETLLRQGTPPARGRAWKLLMDLGDYGPTTDLLCVRLLLSSNAAERSTYTSDFIGFSAQERYLTWCQSWQPEVDTLTNLSDFESQEDNGFLDGLFRSNILFSSNQSAEATLLLKAAVDGLSQGPSEDNGEIHQWIQDESRTRLIDRLDGALQRLSPTN